jgi:hypothetical protein
VIERADEEEAVASECLKVLKVLADLVNDAQVSVHILIHSSSSSILHYQQRPLCTAIMQRLVSTVRFPRPRSILSKEDHPDHHYLAVCIIFWSAVFLLILHINPTSKPYWLTLIYCSLCCRRPAGDSAAAVMMMMKARSTFRITPSAY